MANPEKFENGYHQHDISKLESKSQIAPEDYVEVNENQRNQEIVSKYHLLAEIEFNQDTFATKK